jgi:hypothetical protein
MLGPGLRVTLPSESVHRRAGPGRSLPRVPELAPRRSAPRSQLLAEIGRNARPPPSAAKRGVSRRRRSRPPRPAGFGPRRRTAIRRNRSWLPPRPPSARPMPAARRGDLCVIPRDGADAEEGLGSRSHTRPSSPAGARISGRRGRGSIDISRCCAAAGSLPGADTPPGTTAQCVTEGAPDPDAFRIVQRPRYPKARRSAGSRSCRRPSDRARRSGASSRRPPSWAAAAAIREPPGFARPPPISAIRPARPGSRNKPRIRSLDSDHGFWNP